MRRIITKAILVAMLFGCIIFFVYSDQIATTEDGRTVLLKDDGTWKYVKTEQLETGSKWDVSEKINPVDDSRTITFILIADEGKGKYGGPIGLVLRYMSRKTQVYIIWNSYLGSEAYVLTRLGDQQASRSKWSLSTDSKATFYPHSGEDFIRGLVEVDRFVAQTTPYNESPITAIFDVRGLREAVEPYNDVLKWIE
jgi:type VI secretion system protein VasI